MYPIIDFFLQTPKAAWIAFSLCSLVMFTVALVAAHFNKTTEFSVVKLTFYDNGNISASTARLNGAFLVTAWAFIWLTLSDKLTEWYVAAFLTAWVVDKINSRITKATP